MTLEQKLLALDAVLEDAAPILDRPLLEYGISDPGAFLREAAQRLHSDENRGQSCGG